MLPDKLSADGDAEMAFAAAGKAGADQVVAALGEIAAEQARQHPPRLLVVFLWAQVLEGELLREPRVVGQPLDAATQTERRPGKGNGYAECCRRKPGNSFR